MVIMRKIPIKARVKSIFSKKDKGFTNREIRAMKSYDKSPHEVARWKRIKEDLKKKKYSNVAKHPLYKKTIPLNYIVSRYNRIQALKRKPIKKAILKRKITGKVMRRYPPTKPFESIGRKALPGKIPKTKGGKLIKPPKKHPPIPGLKGRYPPTLPPGWSWGPWGPIPPRYPPGWGKRPIPRPIPMKKVKAKLKGKRR